MNKKNIFIIFAFILAVSFLMTPFSAHAADWLVKITQPDIVQNSNLTDLPTAISYIYNLIVEIAGAIFLLLLLIGGVMYMTSGGAEEQTNKAKKWLLDAIIGLVIVAIAWAAGIWIENSLLNTGNSNPGSSSQPITNTGTSTGAIVGTAPANTTIDLNGPGGNYTVGSDTNGNYSIKGITPGTYTITVTQNGQTIYTGSVTIQSGSTVPIAPVSGTNNNTNNYYLTSPADQTNT